MSTHAKGTFDVNVTPLASEAGGSSPAARMTITKTLHGDLEGTGVGEMLAANTSVEGSAAYVAIERITGTLAGRSGSFVLQHAGTMTRGAPHLVVTVVPDSGTGDLVGLTGTFDIIIAGGKHSVQLRVFAAVAPLKPCAGTSRRSRTSSHQRRLTKSTRPPFSSSGS